MSQERVSRPHVQDGPSWTPDASIAAVKRVVDDLRRLGCGPSPYERELEQRVAFLEACLHGAGYWESPYGWHNGERFVGVTGGLTRQ